jgi:hypothetical protein
MTFSIINSNYVEGFKNAHYNTYMALAEIIDNSIQANARNVHIIGIHESTLSSSGKEIERLNSVLIYDDGYGMDKSTAEKCLVYGGGNNHGAKTNLGKFGMGLPSASGSQCDRTEIYTWQDKATIYKTILDFDLLSKKDPPEYDDIEILTTLPRSINDILNNVVKNGEYPPKSVDHGTIVFWKDCKRLQHKTYRAFYKKFEKVIGRVYRYLINNQGINITLTGFRKINNEYVLMPEFEQCKKVRPNDPLFLIENNLIEDIDKKFSKQSTNRIFSSIKKFKANGKEYNIKLTFTIASDGLRSRLGGTKNAGSTRLGKLYAEHFGISLVRANRELKLSNFRFVDATNAPEHRWWSVEVAFEPDLDEIFGVTFDKQEARNFRKIESEEYKSKVEEDDESLILMHELSRTISSNITSMMKELKSRAKGTRSNKRSLCPTCKEISVVDNRCIKCDHVLERCQTHDDQILDEFGVCAICIIEPDIPDDICTKHFQPYIDGECPLCKKDRKNAGVILTSPEEASLRDYLETNYPNYKENNKLLDAAINHIRKVSKNHLFIYTKSGPFNFIDWKSWGQITIISINIEHPFYQRYMNEIIESENRDMAELSHIHLIIGALIKAEIDNIDNSEILEQFRGEFGMNLKKIMKLY